MSQTWAGLPRGLALSNGDGLGTAVAWLGDLDGDGLAEVAVGAEKHDAGGLDRGGVYVLFLQNSPVFTSPAAVSVPENSTVVMGVVATDTDVPAQTVTYSIVGGADGSRFSITSGGSLSFASPPNFEAPTDANADNVYVVMVQADDGAGGTATQTISVTVTGVNDNVPVFTSADTASVPENTTSVITITATDADLPSQPVTFSIVGGADQSKFGITSGGALSFNTPPNSEAPTDSNGDNVYVVVVQANDNHGGTSIQAILVTVTGVNDHNPVFTSPSTASVAENSTAVMTVTATDADLPAQGLTFSIAGGADQAKFNITSGGALSFVSAPDFETPTDANGDNVYQVVVRASDGSGGMTTQAISVSVNGINDNSPVFTSPDTANVAENTTAVLTVTASDADRPLQNVTFSVVGGADQARFGITSGGLLSFVSSPDFEAPTDANGDNTYVVVVQASDGSRTAIQAIVVNVTNVNEPLPGDYNLNGVVDTADYTIWRDTKGASVAPFSGADGDGDGTIDQDDYGVWKANFGNTLLSEVVAISVTVSEPATFLANVQSPNGEMAAAASASHSEEPTDFAQLLPSATTTTNREQIPLKNRPRPAERHPSLSTTQDNALVAWLASRQDRGRIERPATDSEKLVGECDRLELAAHLVEAFDLAVAELGD